MCLSYICINVVDFISVLNPLMRKEMRDWESGKRKKNVALKTHMNLK